MDTFEGRHRAALRDASTRVLTLDGAGAVTEYGSGFFVAPGLVVTCAHVVPPGPGARHVVRIGGEQVDAEVLVREPDNAVEEVYSVPDVALLRTRPVPDQPCVPLGVGVPPAGRRLYAYGSMVSGGQAIWD